MWSEGLPRARERPHIPRQAPQIRQKMCYTVEKQPRKHDPGNQASSTPGIGGSAHGGTAPATIGTTEDRQRTRSAQAEDLHSGGMSPGPGTGTRPGGAIQPTEDSTTATDSPGTQQQPRSPPQATTDAPAGRSTDDSPGGARSQPRPHSALHGPGSAGQPNTPEDQQQPATAPAAPAAPAERLEKCTFSRTTEISEKS